VSVEYVSDALEPRRDVIEPTDLHAEVAVTHAAVDGEHVELVPGVLLHGVENGLGLEAGCFERCSRDVALLCELCDAEDCAFRVVDPVWCEQTGEGCDEYTSSVVLDACCEITDLV
jgi:hypothetical protein